MRLITFCFAILLAVGCTKDQTSVNEATEPVAPSAAKSPQADSVGASDSEVTDRDVRKVAPKRDVVRDIPARDENETVRNTDRDRTENAQADADNTKRNKVDRDGDTLTPLDQSNRASDVDITAAIRRSVVAKDDLSINAKNAKIITIDGNVTLRGPVKNNSEKEFIDSLARNVNGVRNVDNQLTVTSH